MALASPWGSLLDAPAGVVIPVGDVDAPDAGGPAADLGSGVGWRSGVGRRHFPGDAIRTRERELVLSSGRHYPRGPRPPPVRTAQGSSWPSTT